MSLSAIDPNEIIGHAENEGTAESEATNDGKAAPGPPAGTMEALSNQPISVQPGKIKSIQVSFNTVKRDVNHRVAPHGTAVATYADGSTYSVEVSGGGNSPTDHSYGPTDIVTSKPIYLRCKSIFRNSKNQPMPYALFYNGGEALHQGSLDHMSHGCVHVGDMSKMKKLHDDAVTNLTKVSVAYAPGIFDKVRNQVM